MTRAKKSEIHWATLRLLRPVVRWLLTCGIGVRGAKRLVEIAYAQVGRDLTPPGPDGKINSSRVAYLTGLQRRHVLPLLAETEESEALTRMGAQQRVQRVLWGWYHDRDFQNSDGTPALLPLHGRKSFAELVRRHSGDARVESCLEELVRAGAVRRRRDGRLQVMRRTFATASLDAAGVTEFADAIGEHVETLVHNINCRPGEARYARRVVADRIDPQYFELLIDRIAERSELFADRIDEDLNSKPHVIDEASGVPACRLHVTLSVWHEPEKVGDIQPAKPSADMGMRTEDGPKRRTAVEKTQER